MCLFVNEVPTKHHPLIVKCKKRIKYVRKNYQLTPYQKVLIPTTGWLVPKRHCWKIKGYWDEVILDGFLHAYISSYLDLNYFKSTLVEAYAINVKAYGVYEDLVCRTLYIPSVNCNDSNNKNIIKTLHEIMELPINKQKQAFIKAFPKLKNVVKDF